jgi:hypothetical protein
LPDWKGAEEELRTMLVGAHDIAQRYGQHAATLVRQIEDEIMVEQAKVKEMRERAKDMDSEGADAYVDALERIADLNGALQRARAGHDRAKEFFGAERGEREE